MLFFMCVWESCFLLLHLVHPPCATHARAPKASWLKSWSLAYVTSSIVSFILRLLKWKLRRGVVSDKKKMRRHHKLLKTWKPFFSLLFLWMSCKGCFWVPNVCKARAMWRIVMGRIVSLFSSCTHLFRPFFHPCTDVVAAFTQPRWTFAKYEKWRRPKCLNRLWYFCVGSHKAERKIKKGA